MVFSPSRYSKSHREFIYVNQQLADILGYAQSELVGTPLPVIASTPEDEAVLEAVMTPDGSMEDGFQCELSVTRRDDTAIPIEVHGGAIRHEGAPGCIGLLWDRSQD